MDDDHEQGGPPAQSRSGCAVVAAIAATLLVAIPAMFVVRSLARPNQLLPSIKVCLLVIGVALFGGGIGAVVAAWKRWPRRWPTAASGAVVALSALYAWYFVFAILARLGQWNW